jgi:sulfur relay protein TusB/DsrH
MTTLHIVNRGPSGSSALLRCLNSTNPGDVLLLIEDAVAVAVRGSDGEELLSQRGPGLTIYALKPSLRERSLLHEPLMADIDAIEFEAFVDLTVACDTSVSWA